MNVHSFYDAATGLFTGSTFSTNLGDPAAHAEALKLNTREGLAQVEGIHDRLSRRVDLKTGGVVDYQPPASSADHEWNAQTKRWQLNGAATDKAVLREQARSELATIEAKMPSLLRSVALNRRGALAELAKADDRIAELSQQVGPP